MVFVKNNIGLHYETPKMFESEDEWWCLLNSILDDLVNAVWFRLI